METAILNPAFHSVGDAEDEFTESGRQQPETDWLKFKLDGASWMENNQIWVLELEPDISSLTGSQDLEETCQLPSTEAMELKDSSVQSEQSLEKHESDEIKSDTSKLELKTRQRSRPKKLLRCGQCEKAFRYPSDRDRHQRVHLRQKAAKRTQSSAEAEVKPPLLALQMENTLTKSGTALHPNSKKKTGQTTRPKKLHFCHLCGKGCRKPSELARHQSVHSSATRDQGSHSGRRHRRQLLCDQCGKGFRYSSHLTRHQGVHYRQKAAKPGPSLSEEENLRLLESALLTLRLDNTVTKSSKGLHQNSKATTGRITRLRKLRFCCQCDQGCQSPPKLPRHPRPPSNQRAAKQGQLQSNGDLLGPALQEGNTFTDPSRVLGQNSTTTPDQSAPRKRPYSCDHCGKTFRYPSDLARHQGIHSRQKWVRSQFNTSSHASLEPAPVDPQGENMFTNSSKVLLQNSKATTEQSTSGCQLPFCGQHGKVFQHPCELTQQQQPPRQEVAKRSPSQSVTHNPIPSALQSEKDPEVMTVQCVHPKKPYICKHCEKCFLSASDLAQHQYTHSQVTAPNLAEEDVPNLSGSTAMPILPTRTLADSHKLSGHHSKPMADQSPRMKTTYSCSQCGKHFPWPSSLARHERTHRWRKKADWSRPSDQCRLMVPRPKVRRRENARTNWNVAVDPQSTLTTGRSIPAEKLYLCSQCGERFQWCSELIQHMYVQHSTAYDCVICGRQFKRRVQLVKHLKCHEENREGEEGEEVQNVRSGLGEHMTRELLQDLPPEESGDLDEPFASPNSCECGTCDSGVGNSAELLPKNSMLEIGMSGQPYLLSLPPTCERACCQSSRDGGGSEQPPGLSDLQVEVTSRTTPASEVASSTTVSAASFGEIVGTVPTVPVAWLRARDHIANVPKEKARTPLLPHRASSADPEWLPPMSCSSRLGKRRAMTYCCPVCSKRFKYPDNLRRHLDIHRPGKPYCCPICGKHFKIAEYLRRHKYVHQLGKQHSCPLCEKTFGRRSYLLKHIRIHEGWEHSFSWDTSCT